MLYPVFRKGSPRAACRHRRRRARAWPARPRRSRRRRPAAMSGSRRRGSRGGSGADSTRGSRRTSGSVMPPTACSPPLRLPLQGPPRQRPQRPAMVPAQPPAPCVRTQAHPPACLARSGLPPAGGARVVPDRRPLIRAALHRPPHRRPRQAVALRDHPPPRAPHLPGPLGARAERQPLPGPPRRGGGGRWLRVLRRPGQPPGQRPNGPRRWATHKLAKSGWRGKASSVALYYEIATDKQ